MIRSVRENADLLAALILVLGFAAYLSITLSYSGFWAFCLLGLAAVAYLLTRAVATFVYLILGRWWAATASALKAVVFIGLFPFCMTAGDYIHLAICSPYYLRKIASGDTSVPVRFDWGDKALWVTDGLQLDTLVYDPSDALASTVDRVRDAPQGLGLATRHLVGHFYVEREFSR